MESIFGLPSHPLFIHAPVIIVPMVAGASLFLLFRPRTRKRLGLWWLGAALVSFGATLLANQSGEAFNEALVDRIGTLAETHGELGNQTTLLVFAFFLATAATVVAERRRPEGPNMPSAADVSTAPDAPIPSSVLTAGTMLAGVATAFALLATVWMIRTGHEGARIVWDGVLT